MYCGKLFCHHGNDNPNYGRMVRIGDCKAAFFGDYTKDYGQVDTGTKCGDGKVTRGIILFFFFPLDSIFSVVSV